jgi:hypothetical protein
MRSASLIPAAIAATNPANRKKPHIMFLKRSIIRQKAIKASSEGNQLLASRLWSMLAGNNVRPVSNQRQRRKAMRQRYPHGF